ncbi:DUF1772 domain-containing protein [Mycobacteroides abscessus subsp. abscessus]|nr:DUF1772 domain-containing protein [Mycobacteroides abscessus subsp. abscessus]
MKTIMAVAMAVAIVTTGLVAGTVFAYSNSVMPGLRKIDDRSMVLAIRALVSSVANPVFLCVSALVLVSQLVSVVLAFTAGTSLALPVVLGLVLYLLTLALTYAGNIPLNLAIIKAPIPQTDEQWHALRHAFERKWTIINHGRVLAATLSCVIFTAAMAMHVTD